MFSPPNAFVHTVLWKKQPLLTVVNLTVLFFPVVTQVDDVPSLDFFDLMRGK